MVMLTLARARRLQAGGSLLVLAAALSLHFASSAYAANSVSPQPAADLAQLTIHVDASAGLAHSTPMVVVECRTNPQSSADCEGQTADPNEGNTDVTGVFDNAANGIQLFTAHQLPDPQIPTTPLVCDSAHPCALYVGPDFNIWNDPHAILTLTFSGSGVTTTTAPAQPAITSSSNLSAVATGAGVPVTGAGFAPSTQLHLTECMSQGCDTTLATVVNSDANGAFSTTFTTSSTLHVGNLIVHCKNGVPNSNYQCFLAAGTDLIGVPKAQLLITFASDPATTTTSTTSTSSTSTTSTTSTTQPSTSTTSHSSTTAAGSATAAAPSATSAAGLSGSGSGSGGGSAGGSGDGSAGAGGAVLGAQQSGGQLPVTGSPWALGLAAAGLLMLAFGSVGRRVSARQQRALPPTPGS